MSSRMLLTAYLFVCSVVHISATMVARDQFPQIISHRGASGYVPEHTMAAYQLAIDLKTDYIEPDLCLSKDGVFVALHDVLLDDVTNVATFPQFADRVSTKDVDGVNTTGYFVSDFLYSELQELGLLQRLPERTALYNGLFQIPAFTSIMALAQSYYNSTGRLVGIYPELKHPSFFKSLGFNMEDMLLTALQGGGYEVYGDSVPSDLSKVVPVVIQCFDATSLQYLKTKTTLPLMYLVQPPVAPSFWSKESIANVATYATAIGPEKNLFGDLPYHAAINLVNMIHDTNLRIHGWTFRADQDILPRFQNNFSNELQYFYCCLGFDALFSEFPDRSREAIDLMSNFTSWNAAAIKSSSSPVCTIQCSVV